MSDNKSDSETLLNRMMAKSSPNQSSKEVREEAERKLGKPALDPQDPTPPELTDYDILAHSLWGEDIILKEYIKKDREDLAWAFKRVQLPPNAAQGTAIVHLIHHPRFTILQSRAGSVARSQRRLEKWAVKHLHGVDIPEDLAEAPWWMRMFFRGLIWTAQRYLTTNDLVPALVDAPGGREARQEMQESWLEALRTRPYSEVPQSWAWDEPIEDLEDDLDSSGVWITRHEDDE